MKGRRNRGYVALVTVSALAAVVVGGAAILNGRLHGAWRAAGHRQAAVQAGLAADAALTAAVDGLAREGTRWAGNGEGVQIVAQPDGGRLLIAAASAGRVRAVRRVIVTLDDARQPGERVVAVRWAP